MGESIKAAKVEDNERAEQKGMVAPDKKISRQRLEQKRHLDRHLARQAVRLAVAQGVLARAEWCSSCGEVAKVQAHHPSYAVQDWLIVEWLCSRCHQNRHNRGQQLTRIVPVRFTASEIVKLDAKARKSGVPRATLIRAIVIQMIDAGIEVN